MPAEDLQLRQNWREAMDDVAASVRYELVWDIRKA